MPNDRRPFRLRFRDGRSALAPFPPSLRLRFTFPFAEPQAEAKLRQNYLMILRGAILSHHVVNFSFVGIIIVGNNLFTWKLQPAHQQQAVLDRTLNSKSEQPV
jgi:hypothetical protein